MKHLLLYACLIIAVLAGITLLFEEPLTFILWVGGWVGFLHFRFKIACDDEPKGKPTSHNKRTKLPDDYRG